MCGNSDPTQKNIPTPQYILDAFIESVLHMWIFSLMCVRTKDVLITILLQVNFTIACKTCSGFHDL